MISNNKRIKVLIHNREGGQRRLVEVDKTKTLFELEDGLRRGFNLTAPLALYIDNVELAGSGTLDQYGMADYSIVEMEPTEKEHKDTIITMSSIGLENRMDISRSFFVQNVQFLGLKEPALPETVLEKLANKTRIKQLRTVPLVQDNISSGARQVLLKVWSHFRAFGAIERCVIQQTAVQKTGELSIHTAHAIVTMKSVPSFEAAVVHHELNIEQKTIKPIVFGPGSMGIEVQYRPTFRNSGNVVLIRFIRGKNGAVGQAEKSGRLKPGDLLVGVGNIDVRSKDLKTVRGLIKEQGRPLTLYFREPPDCSEFTAGSHANRISIIPAIALGDDTPLKTEFNYMHAKSEETLRRQAELEDREMDGVESMGLNSESAAAQRDVSVTEAESAAMAALISAENSGTDFQIADGADVVTGNTDNDAIEFKAAPLSERWATLRKAERLWVAHQTLSKVFSRGSQIRRHHEDGRQLDTRKALADVMIFGERENDDDDEEQRAPYLLLLEGHDHISPSADGSHKHHIARRSSLGDVPISEMPFDVERSICVKMIVQNNLPHWLISAIEALPQEVQAVEKPPPMRQQTAAEAAAARREKLQETQKKMQEGFKKATDGFVSGFLGLGNKLKSMTESRSKQTPQKPSSINNVFAGLFSAKKPTKDQATLAAEAASRDLQDMGEDYPREVEPNTADTQAPALDDIAPATPQPARDPLNDALAAALRPLPDAGFDAGSVDVSGDSNAGGMDAFFAGTPAKGDGDMDDFFAGTPSVPADDDTKATSNAASEETEGASSAAKSGDKEILCDL